jgi:putative glutamine amidotransferase
VRPVIGITTYGVRTRWGAWDSAVVLLPRTYVDQIAAAGGSPVLIPPVPDLAGTLLDRIDGLLVAGGPDIDPHRYDAAPHPRTQGVDSERDAAELGLVAGALHRGLPLLGVCRGMQLMNVLRGGTLHQHLPDVVGHHGHAPAPGTFGSHPVRLSPASRLAAALRGDRALVRSHHHQGIDRLGTTLVATGWAEDGAVEALEEEGGPFAVGVLWHPEVGADRWLFRALVAAADRAGEGR